MEPAHQPGLLGHRHELHRRDGAALRMGPAQQRFCADDAGGLLVSGVDCANAGAAISRPAAVRTAETCGILMTNSVGTGWYDFVVAILRYSFEACYFAGYAV